MDLGASTQRTILKVECTKNIVDLEPTEDSKLDPVLNYTKDGTEVSESQQQSIAQETE